MTNIQYDEDEKRITHDTDDHFAITARLLGTDQNNLLEILTEDPSEEDKRFSFVNAKEIFEFNKNALAKTLYNFLFGWLVNKINLVLGFETDYIDGSEKLEDLSSKKITIFNLPEIEFTHDKNGFLSFIKNSVNEQFHMFFLSVLISDKIVEYKDDDLSYSKCEIRYNNKLVKLLRESWLSLDNEDESLKVDDDFVEQVHRKARESKSLEFVKIVRPWKETFKIKHYFEEVVYNCNSFLQENIDYHCQHMTKILNNVKNPFVQDVFSMSLDPFGNLPMSKRIRCVPRIEDSNSTRISHFPKVKRIHENGEYTPINLSISKQFRNSISKFKNIIDNSNSFFIKCLVSNQDDLPKQINQTYLLEQLEFNEIDNIHSFYHHNYPISFKIKEFNERYEKNLHVPDPREDPTRVGVAKDIANTYQRRMEEQGLSHEIDYYKIKKKRIFLKLSFYKYLEENLFDKLRPQIPCNRSVFTAMDMENTSRQSKRQEILGIR